MAEPQKSDPSKSADVVMVGCKLPHGIILELLEPSSGTNSDGKVVQLLQPPPAGQRITLKGANSLREDKRAAQGQFPYAVTPVPRTFWEEWFRRNKTLEFVVKGFVFAERSEADAKAKGREGASLLTGLEALATKDDPRVKQIGRIGGANVETDEDALTRAMAAAG